MSILQFLLEKEFKQILRNSGLPRLILMMPIMMMCVMPFAANREVKDVRIAIVDKSHSVLSRRLVDKVDASKYFVLTQLPESYEAALGSVERGESDIILELPQDFDKQLTLGLGSDVYLAVNAVNGTKGTLGSNYLSQLLGDFSRELALEEGTSAVTGQIVPLPSFSIEPQYRFNPRLDDKLFMVPALLVMVLTMLTGFLPALNIVAEKEAGSIEQINVSPVPSWLFILAKLIPFWVIGLLVLGLSMGLAFLLYGLVPTGSLVALLLLALLHILIMSASGLLVSNMAATMQQAMFVMYFLMMIFLLMSGLFSPITSMPQWAQYLTYINPLRYFNEAIRGIYLRGSGLTDLLPQLGRMTLFVGLLSSLAVRSYRKQS